MPDNSDLPGAWFEMNERYESFQHGMWRNGNSGEVLVCETIANGKRNSGEVVVRLLEESHVQNPTPVEEWGPFDSKHEAVAAAKNGIMEDIDARDS